MKIVAAIVGLLLAVSPASADWQYAKWGMTVDQLAAASKGQMKRCGAACDKQKTSTETALLYSPYQSGEFPFTAFAFFDNQSKQLVYMNLRLDDSSKGYQLIAALKGIRRAGFWQQDILIGSSRLAWGQRRNINFYDWSGNARELYDANLSSAANELK